MTSSRVLDTSPLGLQAHHMPCKCISHMVPTAMPSTLFTSGTVGLTSNQINNSYR